MSTWGWSHSIEGLEAALSNLRNLPRPELLDIASEWELHLEEPTGIERSVGAYLVATRMKLTQSPRMDDEALAYWIWDQAAEQSTCSVGGHNLWMCPYGCHTVKPELPPPSENLCPNCGTQDPDHIRGYATHADTSRYWATRKKDGVIHLGGDSVKSVGYETISDEVDMECTRCSHEWKLSWGEVEID